MPYHEDALQLKWSEVDSATQTLLLALMDVAGAGWITRGVVILILVAGPFRSGVKSVRFLIPVAIILFYAPTLMATLNVTLQTPATAPWYGNALALVSAMFAILIDSPWSRDPKPN